MSTKLSDTFGCERTFALDEILAILARAGLSNAEGSVEILPRDDRIAVRLPGECMAWFALNSTGRAAMARERRVLQLLAMHCGFAAPRVLHVDPSGWELRSMVPGRVDPTGVYDRIQRDTGYAYTLGQDLGRMLAEQHLNVPREELIGWLPQDRNWPRPQDLPFISQVVNDAALLQRIDRALQSYTCIRRETGASVLAHADLGFHNLAVDPHTLRLKGVFDFEGALCGDRHHDFTYMVFGAATAPMLEGALATYEPATGIKIDRHRVRLLNAIAAIGYLAYRHGHAPEESWCGRTLAMDLVWTQSALRLADF